MKWHNSFAPMQEPNPRLRRDKYYKQLEDRKSLAKETDNDEKKVSF